MSYASRGSTTLTRQDRVLVRLLATEAGLTRLELQQRIGAPVSQRCMRGLDVGGFVTRQWRDVPTGQVVAFTLTDKGRAYAETRRAQVESE